VFFGFVIVIVNSRNLQRPQKRRRGNQLIHRRVTRRKSISRGQDTKSQVGRQSAGYGGRRLELRRVYGGREKVMNEDNDFRPSPLLHIILATSSISVSILPWLPASPSVDRIVHLSMGCDPIVAQPIKSLNGQLHNVNRWKLCCQISALYKRST